MSKLDLQSIKSQIVISEFASKELGCIVTKNKTMCCHLHHEKSPSLHLNDEKNFYYCYGCHKAGDVFSLTQEIKNFSFLEAVKFVAESVGIKIENDYNLLRNSNQFKEKKEILHEILEDICLFFESQLKLKSSKDVKDYLINRGLSEEIIKRFRLGFSPEKSNNELIEKLKNKYSENINLLLDSGLFRKGFKDNNFYNILHGRVIFPIFDKFSKVIAFGGRILESNVQIDINKKVPKYINCGDSLVFKKNENLYGENFARSHMKERVIIVEGYLDVLAMHNAEIKNVIAPLGTSVSEFQLQYLWGITDRIVCCFDGDIAGEKANFMTLERSLPIIKAGKFLSFAKLLKDSDPDSLIKENKLNELKEIIENSISLAEQLFNTIFKKFENKTDPDSIAGIKKELIKHLKVITDSLIQQEYKEFFKRKFEHFPSSVALIPEPKIIINNKYKQQWHNNKTITDENAITRYDEIFCYIIVLIFNYPDQLEKFIKTDIINIIYSKTNSRQELQVMLQFAKIHCFNQNLDDIKNKFPRFSNGINDAQQEINTHKIQFDQNNFFLKLTYNLKILNLKEKKQNLQKDNGNFLDLMKINSEEKIVKKLLDDIILNDLKG